MAIRLPGQLIVDAPSAEMRVNSEEGWVIDRISAIFSAGMPKSEIPRSIDRKLVQTLDVHILEDGLGNTGWRVDSGNISVFTASTESELITRLADAISNRVARSLDGYQVIHSGALIRNGHGILIPGASGAGKSTTTAAFAFSGFEYCTDDVAVFGSDRRLRPYPKVLALKPPGWDVISTNFPDSRNSVISGADQDGVTFLRSPAMPDDTAATEGVPVDLILLPRKDDAAAPIAEKIGKSDVIKVLTEQSFDLQYLRSQAFDGLVDIVRDADCYALNVLEINAAVEAVKELTD